MMTNRDPESEGNERPSAAQQESARSLLETVIETADPGGTVPFRSTGYGPSSGELGFSYRNDSLMVEYQTVANAADSVPDVTASPPRNASPFQSARTRSVSRQKRTHWTVLI